MYLCSLVHCICVLVHCICVPWCIIFVFLSALYLCSLVQCNCVLLYHVQSNIVITRSSGGIFWDRGISEARYRFCRQVFFLNLVYIF